MSDTSTQDPMEFLRRAKLVQLQHDRVVDQVEEAARVGDAERVEALHRESRLLVDRLRDIHEEQLISLLPTPPARPERRRWWRFWRHA